MTRRSRGRAMVVRFALLGVLVVATAGCDWTMFGGDAAHTHFASHETAIGVGNVSTLTTKWTGHTGGAILSSPAVANGVVYVGSDDHKLYAFNASGTCLATHATPPVCAPLWTATTGDIIQSSPAVANGVVYVASYNRTLYAFDAAGSTGCSGTPKTCTPLWTATTGGFIVSSPTVVNGVLYIGSDDNKLYAFDAAGSTGCSGTPKTCKPLWTDGTGGSVDSSPAVANGVVYVGAGDGKLYAFDAAGSTGCSGTPKTCTPLYTAATGNHVTSSPAVDTRVVFGVSDTSVLVGSWDGNVYSFDGSGSARCSGTPKTCTPLWAAPTGDWVESSPAVANDSVFVGSDDHNLYAYAEICFERGVGAAAPCPLWSATTGGAVYSSPAVANGVVYVGSADHKVYAFDAAGSAGCSDSPPVTCTPLWSATTGSYVYASPAVANGVVYVASEDGSLYAFGLP